MRKALQLTQLDQNVQKTGVTKQLRHQTSNIDEIELADFFVLLY